MNARILGFFFGMAGASLIALLLLVLPIPTSVGAAPTFTINSSSDVVASAPLNNGVCETSPNNNTCTLRAAIMKANHYPGGGVQINLPAGIYTLTIPSSGSDDETTGDLNITNTMTIVGSGASSTTIDGSMISDRVFSINGAITTNIFGLTIRNAYCGVSCWDNAHSNVALGGGIYIYLGTLMLSNNTLSGNNAGNNGGGIYIDGGTLNLTNSTVIGNGANNSGGIFNNGGMMTLTQSTVISNTSNHGGGGVQNNGGTATLINVTLSGNTALNTGGWADVGGGILNSGSLTLINSTLSGNNAHGNGGGIDNDNGGMLTVINSTLDGNNADESGGGINNAQAGTTKLYNATITNNQADANFDGTGIGGGVNNYTGTLNFKNSILAENWETAFFCFNGCRYWSSAGDCAGPINSQGYNIVYNYNTTHCTINGSFMLTDPKLGPLANNGGATQTHALLAGSPAIDAGDNTLGGCKDNLGATITTDQRGFPRPANGAGTLRCDIGAFELQRNLFLPLVLR